MLIIGHRGARGLAPENTKASLFAALEANVDLIEIDVRSTADGKLVVHHNNKIDGLNIRKTPFDTLKKAKQDVLLLDEAMNIIGHRCPVLIEIKKGTAMSKAIESLEIMELPTTTQFCSFSFSVLKSLKLAFPAAQLTVNEKWSGVRGTYRCRKLQTHYLAMNQKWLWNGFIRMLTRSGYKLSAYTLNNPKKAKKWEKYGLYAVITDYPNRFSA